jgi:uncharacterized protein (DUF983 family)
MSGHAITPMLPTSVEEPRSVQNAILRGLAQRCPACGQGAIFRAYLKVSDRCPQCGEELHHHRADDAPPYFTIIVVGHIVVGGVLAMEQGLAPASWVQAVVWLPLTVLLSVLILPRVKGALVGLQWALRMHGFGGVPDTPVDPLPDPAGASSETTSGNAR